MDLNEYLSELEKLVQIDSGTQVIDGVIEVGNYFADKFSQLGWQVETQLLDPTIAPCYKIVNTWEGEYDILLLGHMDTVYPEGTAEKNPFRTEEDLAYGPGVADMKASILSCYYVLKEMHQAGELENLKVCLALNSEEEAGSPHSKVWIESLARKSKNVLALKHAQKNGGLVRARKGSCKYEVNFTGVAAYTTVNPEKGRSAISEMAYWIGELHSLNDYATGLTVNVGIVSGGTADNIIAPDAKIHVDVRLNEIKQLQLVNAKIEALKMHSRTVNIQTEVLGGLNRPPMVSSAKTMDLAKVVERAGRELEMPIIWEKSSAGSDGNFSSAIGVPTLDGFGPIGGGVHSEQEEYIEINSIEPRQILLKAVITLLKKQKEPNVLL